MRKVKMGALLAMLGGSTLFGGCLGGGNWTQWLWTAALQQGVEFVFDNDGVFDLWEDGGTAALPDTVN